MLDNNNTDSNEFLPPDEQIKRNKESFLEKPNPQKYEEKKIDQGYKNPDAQIAENKESSGAEIYLPPDQQIAQNKVSVQQQAKQQQDNSLQTQIVKFDPENPDYMVQDYLNNVSDGKTLYEAHKANPKLKFGVKQSMAMMDYYNSPNNTDKHPFVKAATGLADFAGNAMRGVQEVSTDVTKTLSPLSFLTGVNSTGLGIGEGSAGAGMFAPGDSYDSRYQQWAMQAYANRQNGLPEPPKPEPPKQGEKSVYYQPAQDSKLQAEYQKKYAEWAKNAGIWNVLTGKGMPAEPKYQQPSETETQKLKAVAGDVGTIADLVAGVPLDAYQIMQKAQQGGIELNDSLGLAIDPNSGVLSYKPKTKAEKLVNFMTRNDIDADRARVNAKAPSNVGKILYYAGEKPTTDGGQQSYAQLLRPLLASYLVPSVNERMLKDPTLTEGQATQQWMKDSESWGSANLQKWASQIPAEKENVAAAAQLLIPETTIFAPAIEAMSTLGKGFREAARLNELSSLMPAAQAMTDVAQTAKEGGTFYVDPNGRVTAGPKTNTSIPRTKEQMREDMYNANLLHKDLLENIEASRLERSSGTEIKLGPWGVPKPYLWADGISQKANTAADTIKQYATAGALGTAIPLTTGAIGAYKHRNEGPFGIGEGFLKGVEYGAAGELAGYTALKGIGKTAGVLADIGKVQQGLQGTGGNVFNIAGNLPTSTKATKDIFGGKIGKIISPTANYLANNLSQWAYQGVEAGTLAAALGILESTPHEEMPSQIANGVAMMMVPHIISSAIHESPVAREKRLGQENASIYWAKKDASNDTKRNMNDIRDYRDVVNSQKGVVFQKDQDLRTLLVNPKSKPEDIKKAQDAYQEADDKLTQLMSANAETMHEYGRQQDLLFANIHRGLNGPLRAGQANIGLEILTKDQILQKLIDQNKELASTPQGMAKLEMIASQDGMVINSAGGVELRFGTDLAEALKKQPIMFDPSKTTAIINSDNARTRAGVYGTTTYDAISHEGGHLYARTKEFQKAHSELLSQLFSTNIYHNDGTIASEDFGAVSNDQLKDMIWNNYLKGKTNEQKKAWLESQGMWDRANDRFIDKEVIPYAREEYIAEMAGNALHQMTSRGGETAVMKWARTNYSNNTLARTIQSVLGNGGQDPTKPSPVMGIKFTPEIAAATEKAIQAVNDYNGHIAPVIDAQPVVEITQQELKKNKGLLKKYGIQSGMFQTQVFATIRDARGNIVGKVPVSNEATPEGSWKIDPNTGRPVQTNGYGQIPDEVNNVQIPEGGSLDVKREVAMQPDGESPIMLSDSQIKKNQKARRDLILNALGITGEIPEQGITWRGTFTPEQIQNIMNLPENVVPKSIKDVILSMNETLASGEGKRWLAEYSPTSGKKGKRKSLMMKMYDVVPIGMHFTKDGNFNVTIISATRIFNKIHAWGAEFPHILDMWGGDKSAFFNDFVTKYLANWQQGKEGWEGLDPDEKTAKMKRDIFNNFLNLKDKDTEHLNQNRFYLKGKMADLDRTIMSMRADHVSSLQPSSAQPIPVDYYKAKINAMPESGLPYQERAEEADEAPKETLTFAPKGEQPALTPDILRGITAVHVPATKKYPTSERGFYSGLQKTIDEKMSAKASPQQILSIVNNPQNAKADEVKWSNLEGFLEGKKSVTKQEVLDYLKNEGAVKFEEVVNQEKPVEGFPNQTISPKYSQYVLPGGDNYREVVLTMPSGETRGLTPQEKEEQSRTFDQGFNGDQAAAARNAELTRKERGGYTSSHFTGTPNYVAHMRLDERKDASGKDGLFIEEIQSDRHQAGREKGYNGDDAKGKELYDIAKKYKGLSNPDITKEESQKVLADLNERLKKIGATASDLDPVLNEYGDFTQPFKGDKGIPDAPFRKDWPVQMFKRALRNAIDSGKEWIGWTSGDTQAERYDLSKQVDEVQWSPIGKKLWVREKGGDPTHLREVASDVTPEKLSDYIGKEAAQKIIDAPYKSGVRTLSGIDLKVGGEGMKGFYDNILPKEIGKYVKKWGAKVEEGVLPKNPQTTEEDADLLRNLGEDVPDSPIVGNETKIWKVEITPEMRESIQKGGQIQFMPSRAGEEERITEATYTDPRTGKVSRGIYHTIANSNAPQEATDRESPAYGFGTTAGRIVDRNEGFQIAQAAGQLKDKLDETYAKAIESGDMEEAQRLVDEKAKQKGGILVFHGTTSESGDIKVPAGTIVAAHVTTSIEEADYFAGLKKDYLNEDLGKNAEKVIKNWYLFGDVFDPTNKDHIKRAKKAISPYKEIAYDPEDDVYNPEEWQHHAYDFFEKNSEVRNAIKKSGFVGYKDRENPDDSYPWSKSPNIAVFDPNNIKSADPITRDDAGNVIPLSQRFNAESNDIRFMPESDEQEPKNLVAVHNTSAEKIENALKIGGFAVPSVAIIRNDRSQFDSFGDITLVAPKGLINPEEEKKSKVFNADVYSPRYPSVSYALNEKDGKKIWSDINSKIKDVPEDRKLRFSFQSNQRDKPLSEELTENPAVQLAFVYETGNQDKINWPEKTEESKYYQEKGIENALRQKLSKWWGDKNSDLHKKFVEWVEKLTSDLGITDQEKLFAGYTPSGTRRYLPHTIENVVKMMTKSIRDGEGFNYGVGSIRSKAAKQFRTMKSIEKSRESIISNEQMERLKDEVNNEFEIIVDESAKTRANQGRDGLVMDAVSSDIKAFAEGGSANMKYLREMYPEGAPYKLWSDYLEKLRGLPTEYFEAKIQRGVDLNEFAGAVVPEGTSQDLINKLENKGLDVVTYPKGDKAARAKAVQGISGKRSDIAFMPKGQTQAAKPIDWSVFTQKTEKPLSTIRAYAVPQQQKDKNY